VAFEDFYWMQASLIINSTEAYSVVAGHSPHGGGGRRWRRRDRWCV